MGRFRFGPVGRLMVVDTPQDGFDDAVEEIGGTRQSLNGTTTKDVFGYKASYKIGLDGLDPRALSWFDMAYRGALGAPLYFVDEQRTNRLTAAASSARSALGEDDPYSNLNGTRTTVANTALLLPGVQDGVAVQTPAPVNAQQWVSTATGIVRCGPMIPVQSGEHMVFSIYVLSGTPVLEFTPFDATGAALPQVGSTATVIAGTTERRYLGYVPAAGVVAVQPCIRHMAAQSSTWTALQFEAGDTPTPWVLGGGGLQVIVDSFPTSRRRLGNYKDATITLLEA
jgi:hypothetical protein